MRILAFALVLIPGIWSFGNTYWDSIWWSKWLVLLALVIVVLGVQVSKIHWSLAPAFLSSALGSLWVFGWPNNQFKSYPLTDRLLLQNSALYFLVAVLLFGLFLVRSDRRFLRFVLDAFGYLGALNAVCILVQFILGVQTDLRAGLFLNPSMSICLTATTLPLLSRTHLYRPILALTLLALLATQSIMGAVVLAAALSALHFRWLLVAGPIGFLALVGPDFTNGRLGLWKLSLSWWLKNSDVFFGMGPGTASVLLPQVQKDAGYDLGNWYIFLHNDWLQVLWEQGIIGLLSVLLVYAYALWFSQKNSQVFSALVALGVCALGNYPIHLPSHAFLGAVLVAYAFHRRGNG